MRGHPCHEKPSEIKKYFRMGLSRLFLPKKFESFGYSVRAELGLSQLAMRDTIEKMTDNPLALSEICTSPAPRSDQLRIPRDPIPFDDEPESQYLHEPKFHGRSVRLGRFGPGRAWNCLWRYRHQPAVYAQDGAQHDWRQAHAEVVLGVLSLIIWTLIIITSVKYVIFAMSIDNDGEGGILALMSLLCIKKHQQPIIVAIGLFGAALIYGDGAITPAISVLSAVEGLNIAMPAVQPYVLPGRW